MPAPTRADLEQAVIDALPADGSWMEYSDLMAALNTSGFWQATQFVRIMKRQGQIKMRVRLTETGQNVHEVSLGGS